MRGGRHSGLAGGEEVYGVGVCTTNLLSTTLNNSVNCSLFLGGVSVLGWGVWSGGLSVLGWGMWSGGLSVLSWGV